MALAQTGWQVEVSEKRDGPALEGAGIQISPNARRSLEALGLDLSTEFAFPKRIEIHAAGSTAPLNSYQLGSDFKRSFGMEYAVTSRARLQAGLWKACEDHPSIQVLPGQTAQFYAKADLIIGADGVNSSLRSLVEGSLQATASGYIACRAVVAVDQLVRAQLPVDAVSLWLGKNAHAVLYPLAGGKLNIVLSTKGSVSASGWSASAPTQLVSSIFDRLSPRLSLALAGAQFSQWNIQSVPMGSAWCTGRVALVGDAAHAMPPFAAQGSAMALEDAVVLAAELANQPDVETGLQCYAQARKPRVEQVARLSTSNAQLYHMSGPLVLGRSLALRATPQTVINARMGWIYNWAPPALPLA